MRQMLFRGKVDNNGGQDEWVYGYLFVAWNEYYILLGMTKNDHPIMIKVIPETVGQYTGKTDTNTTQIFEGDIVAIDYKEEIGVVEWDNDSAKFIITIDNVTTDFDSYYDNELEVMGNVYENPEWLKEMSK